MRKLKRPRKDRVVFDADGGWTLFNRYGAIIDFWMLPSDKARARRELRKVLRRRKGGA